MDNSNELALLTKKSNIFIGGVGAIVLVCFIIAWTGNAGGRAVAKVQESPVVYDGAVVDAKKLTWGKVINFMMKDPKWESIKGEDGRTYVNVSGKMNFEVNGQQMTFGDGILTIQFLADSGAIQINAGQLVDKDETVELTSDVTNCFCIMAFVGMGYTQFSQVMAELMFSGGLYYMMLNQLGNY